MKGSLYDQAHHPGREGSYGLQPWLHGRRCKAVALSTGLPCKQAVMRGYTVCARHGSKAGEASKAIMAAPYDPVAAYARKVKRERHSQYTLLRNAGQAPPPVKESLRLFEQRIEREQRAVRRADVPCVNSEPPSRMTIDPLWRHGGRRSAAEADASAKPMLAAASMQCAGDDETERLRRTVPCLPCRC
jgi:hypothetical protein